MLTKKGISFSEFLRQQAQGKIPEPEGAAASAAQAPKSPGPMQKATAGIGPSKPAPAKPAPSVQPAQPGGSSPLVMDAQQRGESAAEEVPNPGPLVANARTRTDAGESAKPNPLVQDAEARTQG